MFSVSEIHLLIYYLYLPGSWICFSHSKIMIYVWEQKGQWLECNKKGLMGATLVGVLFTPINLFHSSLFGINPHSTKHRRNYDYTLCTVTASVTHDLTDLLQNSSSSVCVNISEIFGSLRCWCSVVINVLRLGLVV